MKKNKFMEEALDIAFSFIALTSPNPAVGAVIVKNEKVVGRGGTSKFGLNHAEVNAILDAGDNCKNAEIYVTLEPCNHFGKTPPCTEAIIKAGIKKVYIAIVDPNPQVSGSGILKLRSQGVEVELLNDYQNAALDLLRPFKKFIEMKKPFVIHKYASTLNGSIATKNGDSKWISSSTSRFFVHKLRAKCDAIIVGKNTVQSDNPKLDIRLDEFENCKLILQNNNLGRSNRFIESLFNKEITNFENPFRVIIGIPENIDKKLNIFYDDNYIIYERESKFKLLQNNINLEEFNIKVFSEDGNLFIDKIMNDLAEKGLMILLLEGGSTIAGAFFDSNNIDQVISFITPKVISSGIPILNGVGASKMKEAKVLNDVCIEKIDDDILYSGYYE